MRHDIDKYAASRIEQARHLLTDIDTAHMSPPALVGEKLAQAIETLLEARNHMRREEWRAHARAVLARPVYDPASEGK